MLTVWGRVNSLNVQKALLCLEELAVPYERRDAGLQFGVVGTPAYRAMNPNGGVPTLVDGDFTLWESNVIVRYLAASHGAGSLWPTEPRARADIDRWMDWQQTSHNPPLTILFWGLVREPGAKTPAELAAADTRCAQHAAMLDAALAERRWIGGETFTMADCVLAPGVHRWLHLPIARPSTPNVTRYYEALMARSSARKVLALPLT